VNIRIAQARRKTARPRVRPTTEPSSIAVRYVLDRYEVSPSLARTIAALAMLGARQ
jgi:hypothetical protein